MAHDAALLGMPLDLASIYYTYDEDLVNWIAIVVDMVGDTHERINSKTKQAR